MKNPQSDGPNLITSLYRSVFTRSDATQRGDYFTPRLVEADAQLRALATRIKGTYRRGALDWSAFAEGPARDAAPDGSEAFWSRGSRVRKTLHGFEIEVRIGAQTLGTRDPGHGAPSKSLVLTPGVTVKPVARPTEGRARFDASWSADEEAATGAERLRLLRSRGPASAVAQDALPPAVLKARDRLIQRAARIVCDDARVFVIGAPLPRGAKEPAELGRGDFEVEALSELIERARALAHALGAA